MAYRVYYDDHKEFDVPREGEKPPARGVQVIIQEDKSVGWAAVTSKDYYILRDGRWYAVDENGLYDYLLDTGLVLFGRMITQEEYDDVMRRAMADLSLARKTGYLPHERKPSG